jgi:glycosyltransferase involved in cell wall biosynthesis
MKLSILMTNFNEEKYILQSITSVLDSELTDFELIVVDDKSSDSSVEIIEHFCAVDTRMKLIKMDKNGGVAKSKNAGLTHCKGELIAMMDADDISFPDRFSIQVNYMDKFPEVMLSGGAMVLMNDGENQLKNAITRNLTKELIVQNVFNHPTIIIRREIFDSGLFRYSERFRHTEDYRLWTRLAGKIVMANLENPLIYFRANKLAADSSSSKAPIRREIELLMIRFLFFVRLSSKGQVNLRDLRKFLATIVRSTVPTIKRQVISQRRV